MLHILIVWCSITHLLCAEKAIIIQPVVDLCGQPHQAESSLAYAQKISHEPLCPRLHQLLYHDVVEVLQYGKAYTLIRVPDFWYITADDATRRNQFWVETKAIFCEKDMTQPNLLTTRPTNASKERPYICLTQPWYCRKLNITYSVGTKFLCTDSPSYTYYTVYAFDTHKQSFVKIRIPRTIAYEPTAHTLDERFAYYQKLISLWTKKRDIIPYVWGGCSMHIPCKTNTYHSRPVLKNALYHRPFEPKQKTGIDCAGLSMLAARTAGLPYPLKNTTTIAHYGVTTHAAKLEVGDIIWIPGHVMLVADPLQGTVLEASHYTHGVGCMRTVGLNKIFRNIHSFADLEQAIAKSKPLNRCNRYGDVYQQIQQAKLISMRATIQLFA